MLSCKPLNAKIPGDTWSAQSVTLPDSVTSAKSVAVHGGRYGRKDRSDGLVAVQDARVEAFGGRAVARGDAAAPKTARSGHHRGRVKLLVAKRCQGGVKVPERQPGLLRGVDDVKEPAVNVLGGTNIVKIL